MQKLIQITTKQKKPDWLKIRPPSEKFHEIKHTLRKLNLTTVCEEAHCPNAAECWSGGTATFMVMGDTCTRGCRFCNIKTAKEGQPLDQEEPQKIAKAIKEWKLKYVVITSVDRDDLPDQGASHFAKCITEIKKQHPKTIVEVLIPDFQGNTTHLQTIIDANPDVIAHNVETVERLQPTVRDRRANYNQSLKVLQNIKDLNHTKNKIFTKTSLMIGLGETEQEITQTCKDLRAINTDIITFGQYLQPSKRHIKVHEYVHPDQFEKYKQETLKLGFMYCASGPFVRSSYKAAELFIEGKINKKE